MKLSLWRCMLWALGGLLLLGGSTQAAELTKAKKEVFFGTLETSASETAKAQAAEWLKSQGKTDAAVTKAFETVWASDRSVLDKVSDTFALGNADAARLLTEARDPTVAAPTNVPELIKDLKGPIFFRANLGLAYSKALSQRRIQEESLETLKLFKAEQVVDPATYLFNRAVAEHSMLQREEASRSILRLLDDVVDAPERYKTVAALMHFDMLTWQEKDLGWVSRMMGGIERRLDLTRGGPQTQDMQKKVVDQLDELIKQMECQCNGQCNKPGSKAGTKPSNNIRASAPQPDSYGGNGGGPGNVDNKKLREIAVEWGKLPEKERVKAMQELARSLPPQQREFVENWFKQLARSQTSASR